jgi:hypothetical protein
MERLRGVTFGPEDYLWREIKERRTNRQKRVNVGLLRQTPIGPHCT